MLLCGLFRGPLNQLFVSAALALPGRKDCAGISGVLVNRVLGWNDLSPAPRARAPPRRPLFNINILELALIFHNTEFGPERPLPNRIYEVEKPGRISRKRSRPEAPTKPACQCSDGGQSCCLRTATRGTSHIGPARTRKTRHRLKPPPGQPTSDEQFGGLYQS